MAITIARDDRREPLGADHRGEFHDNRRLPRNGRSLGLGEQAGNPTLLVGAEDNH